MHVQGELKGVLAGAVAAVGYELWGAELHRSGRHGTLVVFIDNKQGGVTIEDCEKASRQISAVLEVEQPAMSAYALEVSSPGLFRALYTVDQFKRFIGAPIKLRLKEANADNRKNFSGMLLEVSDNGILMKVENEEFNFELNEIAEAYLNPDI